MGSDVLGGIGYNNNYKMLSQFLHKLFSNLLLSISKLGIIKSRDLAVHFNNKDKIIIIPNGVDCWNT
jgi:hypothetical protein